MKDLWGKVVQLGTRYDHVTPVTLNLRMAVGGGERVNISTMRTVCAMPMDLTAAGGISHSNGTPKR